MIMVLYSRNNVGIPTLIREVAMEQIPDPPGRFLSDWEPSKGWCLFCYRQRVEVRYWEPDGGGAETIRYRCVACGRHWWLDDLT
jgi:hypothetical protein